MNPELKEIALQLSKESEWSPDRLLVSLRRAAAFVQEQLSASVQEEGLTHFMGALSRAGAEALGGGDPQGLEDQLIFQHPESPLSEELLRRAWLLLRDDLGRSGEMPVFGGSGELERWASLARSRPWPFVDPEGLVKRIAGLFGGPSKVVILRGPGRSSFLAALRRCLLNKGGLEALVPPVLPASQDNLEQLLRPYIERAGLDDNLMQILKQRCYGEDLVGLLGRAADLQPVALLLDDAWLSSRSFMLGLALFQEPSPERRGLLVLAAPDRSEDEGLLRELILDAQERELLVEIQLPAWGEPLVEALLQARLGPDHGISARSLVAQHNRSSAPDQMRAAHSWLKELAQSSAPEMLLERGFQLKSWLPEHPEMRGLLALAALEGQRFHALSLGKLLDKDEDYVEDLLYDDELELNGRLVGTCERAVPSAAREWSDLPDGLHPLFCFADARLAVDLAEELLSEERRTGAKALHKALLEAYGESAWRIAALLWRLELNFRPLVGIREHLPKSPDHQRIERGFRRLLPALSSHRPYRLALARLYGAGMELGSIAAQSGRVQLSDQAFQAAAKAAQLIKRPGAAGEALARLGEIRLALALPEPARKALVLAESLLEQAGHQRSSARILLLRAEVCLLEGSPDEAIQLLREGISSLRSLKDQSHVALGLIRLGRIHHEMGQEQEALLILEEAIKEADAGGDPRPSAAARMAHAFVEGEMGDLESAMERLNQAALAFQSVGMPIHIIEVAAAGLQRRHGAPKEAAQRLRRMAEGFKRNKAAVQWAEAWHELGRCHIDMESFEEAIPILEEILALRKRTRDRFALIHIYEDLGRACTGAARWTDAFLYHARARQLAVRLKLSARLGRLDASLLLIEERLDARPDQDAETLRIQAQAEVEEMEIRWKAEIPSEESRELH